MPLFDPGDQKILRIHGEPRHPRILNLIFILISLFIVAVGVIVLLGGQIVSGLVVMLLGSLSTAVFLYPEISGALMARRMRKRAEKDPSSQETEG